jgi:glycosyltransferase involved in cell wall biosynthesis
MSAPLAELEMSMGFRSVFNFIPEGSYRVPDELRLWLTENGFEVGVHDLHHDGKLYQSRDYFQQSAAKINHYLKSWNAVGYRSGFMLHNLDWHQELDVLYDSSTFDTDPIEFQPDGMGTIFPFWVPSEAGRNPMSTSAEGRRGYLELPYTLPQDSTLFIVLQEKTPALWLQKLDWVAGKGGMAMVNVHPDYLQFDGEAPSARTFPVAHYRALLEHVRTVHAQAAWCALPREIATYARSLPGPLPLRPKRVCMVTHSHYESDNRVTRYAETLAARGDRVDVLALRQNPNLPEYELFDGVNLHRIMGRIGGNERSKIAYFLSWFLFLVKSARFISRRHHAQPYDLLHVHNMPDFLVYAAWSARRRGAKVILDIHDVVPELYASKFATTKPSWTSRVLQWTELVSARVADHVIISNHLWLEKYAARTGTKERCSVFINNVDATMFRPHPRSRSDGKRVIIFPGSLQWHQGLDIAIRAFVRVNRELPDTEFHIYGDGNMLPKLKALTNELDLNGKVRFFDPVGLKEVARIMADADLGVVPKRADSFGNEAYSTKIMEFMAVGVPVVISRTKIDQFYFDSTVAQFFESGNVEELADALIEVLNNDQKRAGMIANASVYAAANAWSSRQEAYLRIVDGLISHQTVPPDTRLAKGQGLVLQS